MISTPKGLRFTIAILGRTNVGKSSVLNALTNQEISIVSPIPGTTTDIVEKPFEFHNVGPVTLIDTGGLDDKSVLGEKRINSTKRVLDRADLILLVVEPNVWTDYEQEIINLAVKKSLPLIVLINKVDSFQPLEEFINKIKSFGFPFVEFSSYDIVRRASYLHKLTELISNYTKDFYKETPILSDLLPEGGLAIFIIPIDSEAPKGRLILPQVQGIRDVLDSGKSVLVVRDTEYSYYLNSLGRKPDLVVCDSQVVHKMVKETPADISCTTFSILFARYKGDLSEFVKGVYYVRNLRDNDKVLIAEACSHHPNEDDIGRVKIPRWFRERMNLELKFDFCSGRDFPDNLRKYKLIIHCGSCMLTRRELLNRIAKAKEAGVPITNYGVTISFLQGVLERVLSPFKELVKSF